ncbi:MAG: peroxiredoxin family protein [Dehalococcoidia bacterium]
MTMPNVGAPAAPFTLTGIDGNTYSLQEGLDRGPVLLVFFKTTCGTCNLAVPYYNRLRQAYPQDGWQLWAISQDGLEATQRYAEKYQLAFPVLLDGKGWPVSRAYDPPSTPTFYLLDRDSTIAAANTGFSKDDMNHLARVLAERVGAQPVAVAPADDGNPPFRPG